MSNKNNNKKILHYLQYIGPGLLITIGFIDPGNWAANLAAGSSYGYALLWVVTVSTVILIIFQHNAAKLGMVTGKSIAENTSHHISQPISKFILGTSMVAAISTAFAEILGGAIALNMLFSLPIKIGAVLITLFIILLLFTNSYSRLEQCIIAFVSLIGVAFIIELFLVDVSWGSAAQSSVTVSFPVGSIAIITGVLGAVVMPHNLFLHSEIIKNNKATSNKNIDLKKRIKSEYADTITSMIIGWMINSAIIIVAATMFFANGIVVNNIEQAQLMLEPMLGRFAAVVFAVAFLCAGVASTLTVGMAGGSIYSGMRNDQYDIKKATSKIGVCLTLIVATILIFFIEDTFKALIYSQILLSMQLPITIFTQIYLTSSKKIMGGFANKTAFKAVLITIGGLVTAINVALIVNIIL